MQKIISVKPLSESKEWKELQSQIHEALKDPEFVKDIRQFVKEHSR